MAQKAVNVELGGLKAWKCGSASRDGLILPDQPSSLMPGSGTEGMALT